MEVSVVEKWLKLDRLSSLCGDYDHGNSYSSGSGYGCGYGSFFDNGSGYGDGTGCGYSFNDGHGYSYGYSYKASTYGYGYNCGIKEFNNEKVYVIDDTQTIIKKIKGPLAKGYILQQDFTLKPCYIVKGQGYFAHGETVKEAREALQSKIFKNMNTDEAINKFISIFKKGRKYSAKEFYEWHYYLTGSCEMGRKSFMQDHDITFDDKLTVEEFIALCENFYGGKVIKELKERF